MSFAGDKTNASKKLFFSYFCLFIFLFISPITISAQSNLETSQETVLSKVYVSEINYFGRKPTGLDNCRRDGDLENVSQCGFDKWVELYNPTEEVADFNGYWMFFDKYETGQNIQKNEKTSLNGLSIPPKSTVVIYNSRSSLSSIIPKNSPNIQFYSASWMHLISSKQNNIYNNIGFYISKRSDLKPVLSFSLTDQKAPEKIFQTLEFCSKNSLPKLSTSLYYQDLISKEEKETLQSENLKEESADLTQNIAEKVLRNENKELSSGIETIDNLNSEKVEKETNSLLNQAEKKKTEEINTYYATPGSNEDCSILTNVPENIINNNIQIQPETQPETIFESVPESLIQTDLILEKAPELKKETAFKIDTEAVFERVPEKIIITKPSKVVTENLSVLNLKTEPVRDFRFKMLPSENKQKQTAKQKIRSFESKSLEMPNLVLAKNYLEAYFNQKYSLNQAHNLKLLSPNTRFQMYQNSVRFSFLEIQFLIINLALLISLNLRKNGFQIVQKTC